MIHNINNSVEKIAFIENIIIRKTLKKLPIINPNIPNNIETEVG